MRGSLTALRAMSSPAVSGGTIRARMIRGVAWTANWHGVQPWQYPGRQRPPRPHAGERRLWSLRGTPNDAGGRGGFRAGTTGYTATKYLAEYWERDAGRAGRILGLCWAVSVTMGALATIALLVGAGRISVLLADSDLAVILRITTGIVFFNVTPGNTSGKSADAVFVYGRWLRGSAVF